MSSRVALIVCLAVFSGDSAPAPHDGVAGIPPLWQNMCQVLENSVSGDEASFSHNGYRLRGMAITFRHGERSPLVTFDDPAGCTAFRDSDRRLFESYRSLIEGEDFKYFLRTDIPFLNYPRLPQRSHCVEGELTAEGALQHARLGHFLHRKYRKTPVFSADAHLNVTVTSSLFHRTFQSAIAFSSGFLFPHKSSLPQIFVKASNNTFLCTSDACQCPQALQWRKQYEKEHRQVFISSAPAYLRDTARSLTSLDSYKSIDEPFKIMDISLGKYICRRRTLPCTDSNVCLSYDFLTDLINYTTARGTYMYVESNQFIARQLQLVEAHGVLYHLRETMARMKRFPHTNQIKIFSGHDVTVAPLARVLGLTFTDFPHYVSRLVFEIYEKASDSDLYVRVLYNGKDVTSSVIFCRTLVDGLCPSSAFDQFVKYDIFTLLGVRDLRDICK